MIRVQSDIFDPGAELNGFTRSHTDMGAVVSFTGHVRDNAYHISNPVSVTTVHLEHYPGYTQGQIEAIEQQACARWPGIRSLIIHRYGDLSPGEPIVFVAIASPHRATAFEAASFLMDYLKTDAPFWKKEVRADGSHWIEPKESDKQARQSW